MLPFTLDQLHAATGGHLALAGEAAVRAQNKLSGMVVTDSRLVRPGDVFWALPGLMRQGCEFSPDAIERGAAGVVTYPNRAGRLPRSTSPVSGRPGGTNAAADNVSWILEVNDSLASLWQLARWQRSRFGGRVVALTGSVGKTTTRQMIDRVLSRSGTGTTSPHNYNNHVGLPLSMLELSPRDDYAVLELGANAAGEIRDLAALCQPDIGVITKIGEAHVGGFGSREALAVEKTELISALPADGVAILNGDDPWLRKLAGRSRARIVWIGRGAECDLSAERVAYARGSLKASVDGLQFEVPVWGRHHLTAVLAAVAVGRECGIPSAEIADALANFEPPQMRCELSHARGAVLINDAYNASPSAMRAALELLASFEVDGQRIVVCGDMRELGSETENWHRRIGDDVVSLCGADQLVACGHFAEDVVGGARRAGMPPDRTIAFRSVEEAANHIEQTVKAGDVVLIKGSRAMAMERIVERLQQTPLKQAA